MDYFNWDLCQLSRLLQLVSVSTHRPTELIDLAVLSCNLLIQEQPQQLTWQAALQFITAVDRLNKYRKKEFGILARLVQLPVFGMHRSLVYEATKLFAEFNLTKLKAGVKDKLTYNIKYFWADFTPQQQSELALWAETLGLEPTGSHAPTETSEASLR